MARTAPDPLASDLASATFLLARLNEFLAGLDQQAAPQAPLSGQLTAAVRQAFQAIADTWTTWTKTSVRTAIADLDPAEKVLVEFFDPLLDASSLGDQLRSGSLTFPGQGLVGLTQAFAPFLTQLEGVLAAAGFSADQSNLAISAAMGAILLCAFPLWTVYSALHGLAAHNRVVPRLQASLPVAGRALDGMIGSVVATAAATQAAGFAAILSRLSTSLRQALNQKAGPYLDAFGANAQSIFTLRTQLRESDLNAQVSSIQFWAHAAAGKTEVSLGAGPVQVGDPSFPYLGGIYFNAPACTQARSFLALPDAWAALAQAARFVSQAGFWLYVNAANNPYGGRHPPHDTHFNGGDFDLGWTYIGVNPIDPDPRSEANKHENLARMRKAKPQSGYYPIFSDPVKKEDYTLIPIPEDRQMPPTHAGIQKLAFHVVVQAVALSGLRRYLYADAQNMRYALSNLGLAASYLASQLNIADPRLDPWDGTNKAAIPVTEAMAHYNHLHGELFRRAAFTPNPILEGMNFQKFLSFIYKLAIERDQDTAFYTEMLQPRYGVQRNESEAKIKPFRDAWCARSKAGLPSLLPVWLTSQRWNQFMGFTSDATAVT